METVGPLVAECVQTNAPRVRRREQRVKSRRVGIVLRSEQVSVERCATARTRDCRGLISGQMVIVVIELREP